MSCFETERNFLLLVKIFIHPFNKINEILKGFVNYN
jgi:hypothetical protein